jgi:ribokinase
MGDFLVEYGHMYDMITIGDIKLDTFILLPEATTNCQLRMPECQLCISYGTKIPVNDIDVQIAGSAPNVAVGLAKMNKQTSVYSQMGKDLINNMAMKCLDDKGVNTSLIKATKNTNSSFAAVLNYKGESTQLVAHREIEYRIQERFPKSEWIHVSELGGGYEKLYMDVVQLVKKRGTKISFNPGVIQIKEQKKELFKLLKYTTVLFVNKVEAEHILQADEKTKIHNLMAGLKKLGPKYVVITDGQNGAYSYDGKQLDFAPMFPGDRVEATGAGDSFATGFIGALMLGEHHREALRWGSVNAASVVQSIGPTKGLLSHTQIKRCLKARPSYKTKEL